MLNAFIIVFREGFEAFLEKKTVQTVHAALA